MSFLMKVAFLFVMGVLIPTVKPFAIGAPLSSCISMFPRHNGTEQLKSPPPYNIKLSATTYSPLDHIEINVTSWDGWYFQGIMIRARRTQGNTEDTVGKFISYEKQEWFRFMDCPGGENNVVTHNVKYHRPEGSFVWQAPSQSVGDIVFILTLVKGFHHFWANVMTDVVFANTPAENMGPYAMEPMINNLTNINFETECGKTMGCFLYPRLCIGYNCDAAVSYRTDGQFVTFTMMARTAGYIAMAFSEDQLMGEDNTHVCSWDGTKVGISNGYNTHNDTETVPTIGFTGMSGLMFNGRILCQFTRPISITIHRYNNDTKKYEDNHFDLSEEYFLFLASGRAYDGVHEIHKHDSRPAITSTRLNFQEYVIHRGESLPMATRIHACLMLIAWLFLTSLATVVARHFRTGFWGGKFGGRDMWFVVHGTSVCLVFLCTVAGIIIIFVSLREWTKASVHAYLGIAVAVALVVQVVMGITRPPPQHKYRIIFAWVHRVFGKLMHIAAAVQLIFAFRIDFLPAGMSKFGTAIISAWIVVQVSYELVLEIISRRRKRVSPYDVKYAQNWSQVEFSENKNKRIGGAEHMLLIFLILMLTALLVAGLFAVLIY